jgi:hypothetical protein
MARPLFDNETQALVQRLADANFAGRDELCAAAEVCEEASHRRLCRSVADRLGGHAAELQQLLLAHGIEPIVPSDMFGPANEVFARVAADQGTVGIMITAQGCTLDIEEEYDRALQTVTDTDIRGILARQRAQVASDERTFHQKRKNETGRSHPESHNRPR